MAVHSAALSINYLAMVENERAERYEDIHECLPRTAFSESNSCPGRRPPLK